MLTPVILFALLSAPPHPKAYWQAIAKGDFEPPAGVTAAQLVPELVANLASPDPELRDDLSATILTSWIARKKLLGPEDLRSLITTLRTNLRQGIGTTDGDGVLLRSFSALTLSIVVARDNEAPFLTEAEQAALLDSALDYFHDERDLRGFDPALGWMHSAAHTADLLKFLARSARLPAGAQPRILAALAAKNRDASGVFTQEEDERMARVVISIARRPDFDRAAYTTWLETMTGASKVQAPVNLPGLRARQNTRHLLMALSAELLADGRPSEGADFARSALHDALNKLF